MKTCTRCKSEVADMMAVCPVCGKQMPTTTEPHAEPDAVEPDSDSDDVAESLHPALIVDSLSAVPTITESVVDGATVHRGRLLISVADRTNRNNRVYPESVWRREVARSLEKAKRGALTGQAEHPMGRPELLDTILKFTGIEFEEGTNNVYAPFTVIPTAKGRDFVEIVKAGVAVGCSTRGTGSVKREKRGATEVSVIQDDYNLEGIDVMLFGEQSVESARLMQFEHIETTTATVADETATGVATENTELHMPDVKIETLDALREAYPTLLSEAESPLTAKLTEVEGKLVEATKTNEGLTAELNESRQELAALREASEKMKLQLDEAGQKHAALLHLTEVAREQKQSAWLVVEFLKDSPTPQAVDENLAAAVKKAESLIETTLVRGAGISVAQPSDNETKPTDDNGVAYPNAMSLATGTRIR